MQKVRKEKSKKNKGFSLVELIVVIAIMAVLVGIIGTQFVKYVGQSKDTADKTNVDTLQNAANIVLADPNIGSLTDGGTFVISGAGAYVSDGVGGKFKTLLDAALGSDTSGNVKYPVASDKTKKFTITVTKAADGGYSASVTFGTPAVASPTASSGT